MQIRYTLFFALFAAALMIHSCKSAQSKFFQVNGNGNVQTSICQIQDKHRDTTLLESARQAFYKIPNGKKVGEDAKGIMTRDLYDALVAAFDVPTYGVDIGRWDFLGYFITGNDPSDSVEVVYAEVVSAKNGKQNIELKYQEFWHGVPGDELSTILLLMVKEDGRWLLDDFHSEKKEECKQYILEEVCDFLSGKTTQYLRAEQRKGYYSDEQIANDEQEFEAYIDMYKDYILNLLNSRIEDTRLFMHLIESLPSKQCHCDPNTLSEK